MALDRNYFENNTGLVDDYNPSEVKKLNKALHIWGAIHLYGEELLYYEVRVKTGHTGHVLHFFVHDSFNKTQTTL